jgi:hypothetical protein
MNRKQLAPYAGLALLFGTLSVLSLAGCGGGPKEKESSAAQDAKNGSPKEVAKAPEQNDEEADLKAERAKLSPEDQRLVAAQEFCAISTEGRLGSMGPPVKLVLNGQPVFLCCKGCERKARANPEQTLAKVEELKAKVKAGTPK